MRSRSSLLQSIDLIRFFQGVSKIAVTLQRAFSFYIEKESSCSHKIGGHTPSKKCLIYQTMYNKLLQFCANIVAPVDTVIE